MNTIPSHDRIWLINMGDEIVWCDDSNPAGASEAPDTREFVSLEKHAALAAQLAYIRLIWSNADGQPSFKDCEFIEDVLNETSTASLAKLKAQWLQGLADELRMAEIDANRDAQDKDIPAAEMELTHMWDVREVCEWMREKADDMRRQAKES